MSTLSETLLRKFYANSPHPYQIYEQRVDHLLTSDAVLLDAEDTTVAGYAAKRILATYRAGSRGLTLDQWVVPRRASLGTPWSWALAT